MSARTSWDGYLRLNLISIPVKAYSATVSGGGRIGFHQLCQKCHNRIRYKKVCPVHGELAIEQIVSGYEVAKGQYAVVDRQELSKLRPEADKAIEIDVFVHPEAIDPVYFTDRSYYLTPDGKAGQKPYAVLRKVMADEGRYAVASMVLSGREQMVLIRPVESLLAVSVLSYDAQLKKPSAFVDEVGEIEVGSEEMKLARTLVEKSTTDDFDMGRYQDEYSGRLVKYLEGKAGRKRVAAKSTAEEPAIINLMDALKQSIHAAKGAHVKPRKALGHARRHKPAARRKTG